MAMKVKAILFDVDETLFERKLAQKMVLEQIMSDLFVVFKNFDKQQVLDAFLKSDKVTSEEFNSGAPSTGSRDRRSRFFLRSLGIAEEYAPVITDLYIKYYPDLQVPVEGAVEAVKGLSLKYKIGIVSNGLPDVQYRKLETIGIRDLFSCVVISEQIGIRKPDPKIFLYAASTLHMTPVQCLYVGDSYKNDIIGAKGAGMKVCWLNRDPANAIGVNNQVDLVINKMAELPKVLKKYEER